MDVFHSDTLVFFGATGDLAYKKIFPALQAMIKRGHLNVPVIGVAKAGWNLDQLRERAQDSVEKHGGFNPAAFDKLCSLLRYVDGDYKDPATFQTLRKALGAGQHPAQPNYCRFQISPDVTLAFGVNVLAAAEDTGDTVELLASHHPGADEMDAYERVLGDAMAGDASLFAREDYVEEAWRIVDPVLKAGTPVYDYEPNSWGPREVEERVLPVGGWHNPRVASSIEDRG